MGKYLFHGSHQVVAIRGIAVCLVCGAFGLKMPRQLLRPCLRAPSTSGASVLRRIAKGDAPTPSTPWPE